MRSIHQLQRFETILWAAMNVYGFYESSVIRRKFAALRGFVHYWTLIELG